MDFERLWLPEAAEGAVQASVGDPGRGGEVGEPDGVGGVGRAGARDERQDHRRRHAMDEAKAGQANGHPVELGRRNREERHGG